MADEPTRDELADELLRGDPPRTIFDRWRLRARRLVDLIVRLVS